MAMMMPPAERVIQLPPQMPCHQDFQREPAWVGLQLGRGDVQVQGPRDGGGEDSGLGEAVGELELLVERGHFVSSRLLYRVLKRCVAEEDVGFGRRLHSLALASGHGSNAFLANHIIRMYAAHGRLEEAMQVFGSVTSPDAYMWSSIILAHARHGQPGQAIELYRQMRRWDVQPDNHIFVAALKACAQAQDLISGKQVHADIQASSVQADSFVATSLINMYGKCGSLQDARRVFDNLPRRNVVAWNAILGAYSQQGLGQEALALYASMQREAMTLPNRVTFLCLLQACASAGDLQQGKKLHSEIRKMGLEADAALGNCLVDMYAKGGSLVDARSLFDSLTKRDVVSWNAMITGYTHQGLGLEALALYSRMQNEGLSTPDHVTFVCLVQACASVGLLQQGKQLHSQIRERGLESDAVIGNCLVNMYAKCGSLEDARKVFDGLPTRDVVTWTAMIAGYTQQGFGREALALYARMQHEHIAPADIITFACLLQACSSVGALQLGKQLHSQIRARGLEADVVIGSCLVDMYSKCRSLADAREVFDSLPTRNVVTWNAMIAGYSQQGLGREALGLYASMQQEGIIPANHGTFVCLLQACASARMLQPGKQLHSQIRETGLEADEVIGSCLVHMYARCGSLEDARNVFDGLPTKDGFTWTAMISGYGQQGLWREALALYKTMQHESEIPPDLVTFALLLQACASVGALQQGKQLHSQIRERGLEADAVIGRSLVNMYGKCGSLGDARQVFDSLPMRDVVTWTALLRVYAEHGNYKMAVESFEEMLEQGIQPNESTFLSLLVACSHAGLVQEGQGYFTKMVKDHGIEPTDYLYSCMVDLLGRSGQLNEAEHMLQATSFVDDAVAWRALLSACRSHGDVERGRRCFDRLVELEPENASSYVLLGNIYANAGRWEDVDRIEEMRKSAGAMKKPASACIEVKSQVHEFVVGEMRSDISLKARSVNRRLKEEGGHVPQTGLVLKPMSEQEKEDALCGHAEKLALAYGLLNTADGTTLVVTKNLRMCNDCHTSTKIMSQLEKREIIVRDSHRVHRFVDGCCSCGDRH